MSDIERYLQVCGYREDDLVSLGTRAGAEGAIYFTIAKVSDVPRQVQARSSRNVWISANPMRQPAPREDGKPTRGTAEDIVRVDSLWADLDVGEGKMPTTEACWTLIRHLSEALDADPQVVVLTGHGLQPRWRLERPVELLTEESREGMTRQLTGWHQMVKWYAADLGGDVDNVYDLARIIRAPGTMNIKPDLDPVAVRVHWPEAGFSTGTVDNDALASVVEGYIPDEPEVPILPKEESVDLSRGDRYVEKVVGYITDELREARDWAPGQVDDKGRGWEKLCADAAYRLSELAKADWNSLTEAEARSDYLEAAPFDSGWTSQDLWKKWEAQWRRAEPAEPPAKIEEGTQSHDPLADNYVAMAGGETGDPGVREPGQPTGATSGEDSSPGWRKYSWDDQGNAERIIARYGDILRWSPQLDRWLRYENGVWTEDKLGGQYFAAKLFDELPTLEAGLYDTTDYQKGNQVTNERLEFLKFWAKQRFTAKAKAAADAIKATHRLDARTTEFDQQTYLLNCKNGVVDLEDGTLHPHDPELMMRRQTPVEYDPDAECPTFEKFLQRVQPDDQNRAYLQRIVGYSITASTGEQSLFIHHGPPAAGKSVFLRIMEAILGPDLSRVIPPTTLLAKRVEQHPTDISGLEGRRMLQMSEVPQGARLDEAVVKRMTGEETITARGMNQDFRDFRILGKVHIAANDLPRISDDRATHRRIHIVPWTVEIPPHERDLGLADRVLADELPGVLAWAVRGTQEWLSQRLDRPESAERALAEYIEEEDELGEWIRERLLITGPGQAWSSNDELYRHYRQWADASGIAEQYRLKKNTLAKRLATRGIDKYRSSTTRGFYAVPTTPSRYPVPDPLG